MYKLLSIVYRSLTFCCLSSLFIRINLDIFSVYILIDKKILTHMTRLSGGRTLPHLILSVNPLQIRVTGSLIIYRKLYLYFSRSSQLSMSAPIYSWYSLIKSSFLKLDVSNPHVSKIFISCSSFCIPLCNTITLNYSLKIEYVALSECITMFRDQIYR